MAETYAPGVSGSPVARRHDLNANLVFKWRRDPRLAPGANGGSDTVFLPVEVGPLEAPKPVAPAPGAGMIEIVLANGQRLIVHDRFIRCFIDHYAILVLSVLNRTLSGMVYPLP